MMPPHCGARALWHAVVCGQSLTYPPADVRLTMLAMPIPVLRILCRQGWIADDQQVLGVLLLDGFGEVETSRDDDFAIDVHDLVMRNRVVGVNHRGHPLVRQEIGRGDCSARRLLSRMTWTCTPRLWASSS